VITVSRARDTLLRSGLGYDIVFLLVERAGAHVTTRGNIARFLPGGVAVEVDARTGQVIGESPDPFQDRMQ